MRSKRGIRVTVSEQWEMKVLFRGTSGMRGQLGKSRSPTFIFVLRFQLCIPMVVAGR